jgi:hypothetical protein
LAKPGLSGFSSNSSEQMAQTLIGKGIISMIKPTSWGVYRLRPGLPMVGREYLLATNGSANRGVYVSRSDRTARRGPGRKAISLTLLRIWKLADACDGCVDRHKKCLTKLYVSISLR